MSEAVSETLGADDAASLLRLSVDALLRKARAGIIPGARIGREWVFVREDLIELIRTRAQERACHSIAGKVHLTGGSSSTSAAARCAARLAQLTASEPRSSRRGFEMKPGGSTSWVSVPDIRGAMQLLDGSAKPAAEGDCVMWIGSDGSLRTLPAPRLPRSTET